MKRLFIFLAAAMMAAGVMATEYIGSMQMASGYTLDDVRVSIDEQGNMTLYRVKFARMMPVRVDVIIPQINCDNGHINGESIIPLMNNKQKPDRIGGKEMHYNGTAK